MDNKNKTIFNIILSLICVFGIYYYIFSKYELMHVIGYLKNMDYKWLIYAIISILVYIITDVLITFFMTRRFHEKASLNLAVKTVLGLYVFNNITPFATGGFPYQLYLYTKRGIPISKTSTITITRNVLYQSALIIYSIIALLFIPIKNRNIIIMLISINVIIQIIGIVIQILAMYKPEWSRNTAYFITEILNKIKIVKNVQKFNKKIDKHINDFSKCNQQLKNNGYFILKLMVLQFVSFLFLFSCGFFVFKGFDVKCNYISIILMISCIYLFGFVIPTPGGAGGIEGSFYLLFEHMTNHSIIVTIMLVWRLLTYYLLILIGSLSFLISKRSEKKNPLAW